MDESLPQSLLRVLLVDDQVEILEVLGMVLEDEGFVVAVAESGRHAILVASSFRPDVVVCDLQMPLMDGVETARRLRNEWPPKTVAFLAHTASAAFDERQALAAGFHALVRKPAEVAALIAAIKTAAAQRDIG